MTNDPRDILWQASFEIFYETYFEEILSELLIKKWMRIDYSVRILIAITASGSAVAGWTLWENPNFKIVWVIISGAAALFGIIHTTLAVPNMLKEHINSNKGFTTLRHELENFRNDLNLDPNFDVQEKNNEYKQLKRKYTELCNNSPHDILSTDNLSHKAQDLLDERIQDIIER